MKKKTQSQLAIVHNHIARLNNTMNGIDVNDFTPTEQKAFKGLKNEVLELILKYSEFKTKALTSRGLEIKEVL